MIAFPGMVNVAVPNLCCRCFPVPARADLHVALNALLGPKYQFSRLLGVHREWPGELTFSHLIVNNENPVVVAPLRYEEEDIGDSRGARLLHSGLWLCEYEAKIFAVFLSPATRYGEVSGINIEIAVQPGESGAALCDKLLRELEESVRQAGTYRGKVLSLETERDFRGHCTGIKLHKLRKITRDELILPEKTIALLDRNLMQFSQHRAKLRALRLPTKKGLLFYGPPGAGKTHTIHYIAGALPGHTTLLITAEQVGLLSEYMQLARFLQPAIVVIEDVDLIARDRRRTRGPCDESLLNRLLKEMDGLREDAELFFILTTNRPEELEPAIASRPGRIDQGSNSRCRTSKNTGSSSSSMRVISRSTRS